MNAEQARRIERNVERTAAALFAGALGFAAYSWWLHTIPQPTLGAYTGGIGAITYLLCVRTLRAIEPRCRRPVRIFDLRSIQTTELPKLTLTEADRLYGGAAEDEPPLVLDDVLAELQPDSRVVRLFDRQPVPTPGQLKARIDTHLAQQDPLCGDASQALSDALAELRRALR